MIKNWKKEQKKANKEENEQTNEDERKEVINKERRKNRVEQSEQTKQIKLINEWRKTLKGQLRFSRGRLFLGINCSCGDP